MPIHLLGCGREPLARHVIMLSSKGVKTSTDLFSPFDILYSWNRVHFFIEAGFFFLQGGEGCAGFLNCVIKIFEICRTMCVKV